MKLLFFTLLTWTLALSGAPIQKGKIVRVEVYGNEVTQESTILNEVAGVLGEELEPGQLQQLRQALYNLRIFSLVEVSAKPCNPGICLVISVEEKWTLIPIFKLGSGGGRTKVTVGAYDVNVFGEYLEFGGQLEKSGGDSSGVFWFRNPRLFGGKSEVFLSLWDIELDREIFAGAGLEEEKVGLLMQTRKLFSFEWSSQVLRTLRLGLKGDYTQDGSKELEKLAEGESEPIFFNSRLGLTDTLLLSVFAEIGNVDYENHIIDGLKALLLFEKSQCSESVEGTISGARATLQGFTTLGRTYTLASRLEYAQRSTNLPNHYFFLGGLESVRGFNATRFYGNRYQLLNTEFRDAFYQSPLIVLQYSFFADALKFGMNDTELDTNLARSWGIGFRAMAPTVYRLVVRMDYAFEVDKELDAPLSFGIQQFF